MLGKKDDCRELMSLRSFRDNWLENQPGGKTEIQEYYSLAPRIIAAINAQENAGEIYSGICEKYIVPCVGLIDRGENGACHALYKSMIESLRQKYVNVAVEV
jgi:hypothetical protein